MNTIRIGVLGAGGKADSLVDRAKKRQCVQIAALCDVSREITQKFADWMKKEGFDDRPEQYTDPAAMYDRANLDAVIIATPHTLHYKQGMQALEAGLHIYMEKPMTTSSEDARNLAEAAEQSGKTVVVGYNTPSTPPFQYLREKIREGYFGKLEMVSGYISQNWLNNTRGTWRQDPALSGGGQAYDSGAHLINSLVWLVEAPVADVFAFVDNCGAAMDINSVIGVRFANGVIASLAIGGNCATNGRLMVYIFDDGRVEIDGWTGRFIRAWKGKEEIEVKLPEEIPHAVQNFVDVILGKAEPATTPWNGVNHSMLMDAIYKSAEEGVMVKAECEGVV